MKSKSLIELCLFSAIPSFKKVIDKTVEILSLTGDNVLNPKNYVLGIKNNLYVDTLRKLGEGTYGGIFEIEGYAIKAVDYSSLGQEVSLLVNEATVLSIVDRLRFVGWNDSYFYIGMDLCEELTFERPYKKMKQISRDLYNLHKKKHSSRRHKV